MTLESLAVSSGVSRAALSKIERGERQPSLHNALQIAEALRRPLTELVGQSANAVTVVRQGEARRMLDPDSGTSREALLAPAPGCEVARYTLPPRAVVPAFPPHQDGSREVFVVIGGSVEVTVGGTTLRLSAGDAAALPSDREHRIQNPGDTECILLLIILRPRLSLPVNPSAGLPAAVSTAP